MKKISKNILELLEKYKKILKDNKLVSTYLHENIILIIISILEKNKFKTGIDIKFNEYEFDLIAEKGDLILIFEIKTAKYIIPTQISHFRYIIELYENEKNFPVKSIFIYSGEIESAAKELGDFIGIDFIEIKNNFDNLLQEYLNQLKLIHRINISDVDGAAKISLFEEPEIKVKYVKRKLKTLKSIKPGLTEGTFSITVRIKNKSDEALENLVVKDLIPAGFSLTEFSPPAGVTHKVVSVGEQSELQVNFAEIRGGSSVFINYNCNGSGEYPRSEPKIITLIRGGADSTRGSTSTKSETDGQKVKTKKIKNIKENILKLPSKDGNYNLFNRKGDIVYTGEGNIKERIFAHKRNDDKNFTDFSYNLEPSTKKRKEIQVKRIKKYKPSLNR